MFKTIIKQADIICFFYMNEFRKIIGRVFYFNKKKKNQYIYNILHTHTHTHTLTYTQRQSLRKIKKIKNQQLVDGYIGDDEDAYEEEEPVDELGEIINMLAACWPSLLLFVPLNDADALIWALLVFDADKHDDEEDRGGERDTTELTEQITWLLLLDALLLLLLEPLTVDVFVSCVLSMRDEEDEAEWRLVLLLLLLLLVWSS